MYSRFVWGFGAAHDLFSGSVLPGHEDGSEADDGHEDDQVVQFFEQDYELKQDTFRAVLTPEVSVRFRGEREAPSLHRSHVPSLCEHSR